MNYKSFRAIARGYIAILKVSYVRVRQALVFFNKETQRFTLFLCSLVAYVDPKGTDTCVMYAGSCEDF